MRNRFLHLRPVLDLLGGLFWVFGLILLVPLVPLTLYSRMGHAEVSPWAYLLPALLSLLLGVLLKRRLSGRAPDQRGAMLLCALGWIGISATTSSSCTWRARGAWHSSQRTDLCSAAAWLSTCSSWQTAHVPSPPCWMGRARYSATLDPR